MTFDAMLDALPADYRDQFRPFRGADPQTFIKAYNAWVTDLLADEATTLSWRGGEIGIHYKDNERIFKGATVDKLLPTLYAMVAGMLPTMHAAHVVTARRMSSPVVPGVYEGQPAWLTKWFTHTLVGSAEAVVKVRGVLRPDRRAMTLETVIVVDEHETRLDRTNWQGAPGPISDDTARTIVSNAVSQLVLSMDVWRGTEEGA